MVVWYGKVCLLISMRIIDGIESGRVPFEVVCDMAEVYSARVLVEKRSGNNGRPYIVVLHCTRYYTADFNRALDVCPPEAVIPK